jgi:uncharacterized protein YcfJ
MWTKGLTATAAVLLMSAQAHADDGHRRHGRGYGYGHGHGRSIVYARVIEAQPIVRYVTVERPRRECWQDVEYRPAAPARVAGTTLAGGIVGAAIGRQFGDGSGRDAMTLIGGLAGSVVAHERATRRLAERGERSTYAVPVERCEVVRERFTEEVIDGYRVVYLYEGRRHSMRTLEHPGTRVPLQVSFRPARF